MERQQATESDYFWSAVMFYTRIPVPSNVLHSQQVLNRSRKYFPLIGLIVGMIAAVTFILASLLFSVAMSLILSMLVSLLVTGAFHEDGFADSCDGFGGGWTQEQVLEIMKDSRVGTYATVGLIFLFSVKYLALIEISGVENTPFLAFIFIAAHTSSRSLSSLMIDLYDYVQDIDQSKVKPITERALSFEDKVTSIFITSAALVPIACMALTGTLLACSVAAITAFTFMAYSRRRIGGYTGDVLGAIQQLSELAFYLCFAAVL